MYEDACASRAPPVSLSFHSLGGAPDVAPWASGIKSSTAVNTRSVFLIYRVGVQYIDIK